MIKDVAFIAYAVRDVPRSVAFYQDVLGLQTGESFNENFVEFNIGSTAFAIDGDPPPGCEAGTCSGLNFEVEDILAARERLVHNNVVVSDVYNFPTCSVCFAKDPDGNGFALHQKNSERRAQVRN
jgi:predicted enzyme related to lactoylglutathione lyase